MKELFGELFGEFTRHMRVFGLFLIFSEIMTKMTELRD